MPTIINSIHIIIAAFLFIITEEARTKKNCFPPRAAIDPRRSRFPTGGAKEVPPRIHHWNSTSMLQHIFLLAFADRITIYKGHDTLYYLFN
jgi:hypothetical protein